MVQDKDKMGTLGLFFAALTIIAKVLKPVLHMFGL